MVPDVGKIPLADALLIEDPSDHGTGDDDGKSETRFLIQYLIFFF